MEAVTHVVQVLVASQALLFSFFLLTHRSGKRVANRWAAAMLLLLAAQMSSNLFTALPNLNPALGLLYGPLLFCYARSLIEADFALRGAMLLHAVPFCAGAVAWLAGTADIRWFAGGIYVSLAAYLILTARRLRHYRRILDATRSSFESIALGWLWELLALGTAVLAADVAHFVITRGAPGPRGGAARLVLFLLLFVLVNRFVLKGLRHGRLFAGVSVTDRAVEHDARARYPADRLTDEVLGAEVRRLESHLDRTAACLDPDLSLDALAGQLELPPRRLSQVINRGLGCSFSELVNRRRIQAAQALLRDPARREATVLAILHEVGFRSKSTFNDAFRRQTGMTPSDYRRAPRSSKPTEL